MRRTPKVLVEKRSLKPFVPSFIVNWAFPELEDHVHENLNFGQLVPFLSPEQESGGRIQVQEKMRLLKETGFINQALNLDDGRGLVDRGIPSVFNGRHLFLWRSAGYDNSEHLFIPFIQNISGQPLCIKPIIYWYWFGYDLLGNHCAPLLKPD